MNEFNDKVKRILKDAEKEMFDLNHPYVGSEHLLLSLLRLDTIKDICSKYDLTYEIFKEELLNIVGKSNIKSNVVLYTPLLRKILDTSIKTSKKRNIDIDEKLLLEMVLASDEGIALRVIDYLDIDINSLYNDITSKVEESVLSIGEDLNKRKSQILIGRDKEINSLIEILLR